MEEHTADNIYTYRPSFTNTNPIHHDNDRLGDIENSIRASLIVGKIDDNNKCRLNTTLKILITFSFIGLVLLIGVFVVLFIRKF